jgi:hypothetical protein
MVSPLCRLGRSEERHEQRGAHGEGSVSGLIAGGHVDRHAPTDDTSGSGDVLRAAIESRPPISASRDDTMRGSFRSPRALPRSSRGTLSRVRVLAVSDPGQRALHRLHREAVHPRAVGDAGHAEFR